MPKPIILKSSPHSSRDRAKFGYGRVDPSDGLSKAELKILNDLQDAVTESGHGGLAEDSAHSPGLRPRAVRVGCPQPFGRTGVKLSGA